MGLNFPGSSNETPSVVTEIRTMSRGVAVPVGLRTAAIMGEGLRVERLVSSAVGAGNDGLNDEYTSTSGRDGRHFKLTNVPIISNRLVLYKNGIPLDGLEQDNFNLTGGDTFSNSYDYRYDTVNGLIELQVAALVDQGGSYYRASTANVGDGIINGLALLDTNAPTETWTARVSSVVRDTNGDPIDGYATFIVKGSISGVILDGYGNPIVWHSDGDTVDNTILQFSISEGASAFIEGDAFIIKVASGALSRGDSLVAHYIAETDLNDPEFFSDLEELQAKHGAASLTNRLSLGAQVAFSNGPPGVWACQTKPAVPRRVSYTLEEDASGGILADDLEFALPLSVVPDVNANINFFVTDAVTGEETQIVPNKVEFYDSSITSSPNSFHFGTTYTYAYTVVLEDSVVKEGDDGVITSVTGTTATLSSDTITFVIDDDSPTRTVQILNPATNAGSFAIASVVDGVITLTDSGGFTSEEDVEFRIIDTSDESAKILFTDDVVLGSGDSLRATVVDQKDAEFFDVGWLEAYEALERIECDMVVPLPSQTISAIFQNGNIHCQTMSNFGNKKERVLFIGAISGLEPEHVIGTESAAVEDIGVLEGIQGDSTSEILEGDVEDLTDYGVQNAFGDTYRAVFMYPDEVVVQIGADRTLVDGFFMAPAAAGLLSGIPYVGTPLTNRSLAGFTILRDKLFRPRTINELSASGITVVQPAVGGGRVIWGKTTTNSLAAEEEEISVVFIRDRIAKSLRAAFRGFIGVAETPQTQGALLARANSVFNSFVTQRLITQFANISVVRDSSEPRQWNIRAAVQPVYPINWISISVDIGLI